MQYDYPPSKHITKYGPLIEDLHFFAKGQITFDNEKYECEFEVAYTQNCEIIVVCYLSAETINKIYGSSVYETSITMQQIISKTYSLKCTLIQGLDLKSGYTIEINHCEIIQPPFLRNSPTILSATSFTSSTSNKSYVSYLCSGENLYYVTYHILGVYYPFSDSIQFDIADEKPIILEIETKSSDVKFDNETTAVLKIPIQISPSGWTSADMADLCCALLSLAIGRDIRWTTQTIYSADTISTVYVSRRNVFGRGDVPAFITKNMFIERKLIHRFIYECFKKVLNGTIAIDAVNDYVRVMRHFIEYQLITSRMEDQTRLVSTTVEELLGYWEKHTKNLPAALIHKAEATQLMDLIKLSLNSDLSKILDHDSDKALRKRKSDIENRLNTFFKEDILRPGFHKRLKNLFVSCIGSERFKDEVGYRLEDFVTTRNKIAHEGTFPGLKEDNEENYYNALAVIPLMIFAIFGYIPKVENFP